MKRRLSLSCALLVCLAWMPAQAQVLYDAFSGNHIDPAKWIATPMCVASGHDCAREVRNGHLRLAVRGYGAATHSSGVAVAESQLLFANPEAIETIQFRFTVTSSSSKACPANVEAAHPQLLTPGGVLQGSRGGRPRVPHRRAPDGRNPAIAGQRASSQRIHGGHR